jgi:hypothetical protein
MQVRSRGPIATHPVTSAAIAVVTIAAIFFALRVPIYASEAPKAGAFPWFSFYLPALIFKAARVSWGADETQPGQYTAEPVQAPAPAGAGPGAAGAARDLPRPRRPHATGW